MYTYDIIISESEVNKVIELIEKIVSLVSAIVSLATVIATYKLTKKKKGDD